MSCPFVDPSMLSRLPSEKREELKDMYHKMKKDQSDHLKIDINEDLLNNTSPEQMMMGMTGASTMNSGGASTCPVMSSGSSGGSQPSEESEPFNLQE